MIRNPCHRRRGMQRAAAAGLCALLAGFLTKGAVSGEQPLPVVEFAGLTTTTTERDGKIALKVEFSHAFSGRLTYSVDGTAEPGMDFDYAEAGIDAEDPVRETEIVIRLRDDALVEDMETIRVTLQSGDGFLLGSRQQHTVSIRDNDANWRVVHDVDGMRFDYRMQIVDNGGNTAATVTSDGGNGLPTGTYPVELAANDSRFEATIGPIAIAADQTLLGAKLARTFTLLADPSVKGHTVDYEGLLVGSAVETWTATESASHLTRGKPILGTFLMSRTTAAVPFENAGEDREGKESSGSRTATSLTDEGPESGCGAVDMSGTRNFSVTPRKLTPQDQQMVWIGQPFAPYVPYPNFVAETLNRARADLYYDKASTQEEKNAAAFRYKTLLYEKEKVGAETYIRAQFEKIEDLWDCAARKRANQTAQNVIGALRYAPWNRELRWALLDIYYDIAVAEKALAQEKHVAVAEIMIKEPAQGELLIHEEIAKLEEALPLYRKALAGYMKVMQHTFGVDVADFETDSELLDEPFGYHVFRKEVALRSPLVALFRNDDGNWIFPQDAGFGDERPRLFQGYKDVTLLFELLREYLRTAEQLSKGYVMRGGPSDIERAERLIGDALLATWLEGNALLAMFPEIDEEGGPIDPESGLREAVAGWRHSYSALGHMRSMLSGYTNILGFADDFLVLPQSVVPGDPNQRFHSYDFFKEYLSTDGSPLGRAKKDLVNARVNYGNYRDRNDQLAQQFHDRAEHYDSRLREIVGVSPGELGYEDSTGNKGGAISQQILNIEQAHQRIAMNRQRIENLQEQIRIEIGRRGREKGINDAISKVNVKYGSKQEELTNEIAKINGEQAWYNNLATGIASIAAIAAAPATGGASLAIAVAYGGNAFIQESKEEAKGRLQASKERHAAQERLEVQSLQDGLLDVNSKARIETLLLQMSTLALESASAAIGLRQEAERLFALYLEKEDLERRKAETNERLAGRYFADPSHRLLSRASMLRSRSSFADAQRWMFLAIRAAEYKWNLAFEHTTDSGVTFTKQTLFRTRNARELDDLFSALDDWDQKVSIGTRNDDGYKKFSIKTDFLSYKSDDSVRDSEAFQQFVAREDNYLDPEDPKNPIDDFKVLKLRFNTTFVPDTGGLFMRNRWLEKVKFLRVRLIGGAVGSIDSTVEGYLSYGGVSLIRNQTRGTPAPDNPDRLVGETTAYSTQHWFQKDGQWRSKEAFGSPIYVQISKDPDVPLSVYKSDTFKEYSVATSEWTLYIAVEKDGVPLVDVSLLTDIEFHLYYYWYARN